jgi:hypothetical protein
MAEQAQTSAKVINGTNSLLARQPLREQVFNVPSIDATCCAFGVVYAAKPPRCRAWRVSSGQRGPTARQESRDRGSKSDDVLSVLWSEREPSECRPVYQVLRSPVLCILSAQIPGWQKRIRPPCESFALVICAQLPCVIFKQAFQQIMHIFFQILHCVFHVFLRNLQFDPAHQHTLPAHSNA